MNIPNILTVIRFLLIPVFLLIFYSDLPNNILLATLIFILAGITDILDGYIARKYDKITRWGIVCDPLADKLMLISVLYGLTDKGYLPPWVITVIAGKEAFMGLGAAILYFARNKTVIPANKYGKITTILFYFSIVALVLEVPYSRVLILAAVFAAIIAFINYARHFKNLNITRT